MREVINTILRLNKEKGITVILITHYMDEAEFADRVIIMDDGKIVKDGTAADIFSNVGVLEKSRLSVPQTTELLNKLEISAGVVSVEDTVAAIVDSLKTEE